MPEYTYATGRIRESLQFIASEMQDFEEYSRGSGFQEYQKDKKYQKVIDRTVENILTALIEICGAFLAERNIAIENYAQILSECLKQLEFLPEEVESIASLAQQRNRLAHRYLNFRWQAINLYIQKKPIILKLLEKLSDLYPDHK